MRTLPDYLREGLDLVFVGLNPSLRSVAAGRYFANPRNRFWSALHRSGLVRVPLTPDLDHTLPDHGIGLTDVVKRPTSGASALTSADFRRWAPLLGEKLLRCRPRVVCFHGVIAYGRYLAYAEGVACRPRLGLRDRPIGSSRVFVVPNPSPANARFSAGDLVGWYRLLKAVRDGPARHGVPDRAVRRLPWG